MKCLLEAGCPATVPGPAPSVAVAGTLPPSPASGNSVVTGPEHEERLRRAAAAQWLSLFVTRAELDAAT